MLQRSHYLVFQNWAKIEVCQMTRSFDYYLRALECHRPWCVDLGGSSVKVCFQLLLLLCDKPITFQVWLFLFPWYLLSFALEPNWVGWMFWLASLSIRHCNLSWFGRYFKQNPMTSVDGVGEVFIFIFCLATCKLWLILVLIECFLLAYTWKI